MSTLQFTHALLIVRSADGKVLSQHRLNAQPGVRSWLTMGRSLSCDVVLNDVHVAARHAEIAFDEIGQLLVTDLGSINGTRLNQAAIHQSTEITQSSQTINIGRTQLELLAEGEAVAAEVPLPEAAHQSEFEHIPQWIKRFNSRILLAITSILMLVYGGFNFWSSRVSHRELWVNIAGSLLSGFLAVLIWVGLWALISRVASGKPRWVLHACIALSVALVFLCFEELIDLLGFAASTIVPSQVMWWWFAVFGSLLLFMHLRAATHLKPVRVLSLAVFLPALFLALAYWQAYGTNSGREARQTDPVVLLPPALRIIKPDSPSRLFDEAKTMKAEAVRLRDKAQAENNQDAGGDMDFDD